MDHHARLPAKPSDAEHFRALAENSAVGVWQTTPDGYTVYLNPAMCAILEVDGPGELSGVTYHRFLTPRSLRMVEQQHHLRAAGKSSQYEVEIISKQGKRRHLLVSGAPLFSYDGKIDSYIGTFCDVTARKEAEDALRESEAKYRTLVQTAHDFIWACDLSGTVTFVNQAWERIVGWKTEEMVGRPFTDFLPPEDAAKSRQIFNDVTAGKEYTNYETGVMAKDGKVTILSFNSALLRDESGQVYGVMGTAQDVTERIINETLREDFSQQLLEAIDAERRRIARELHDNIGQSLAALGLQFHALLRARGRLDGELREAMLQISKQLRVTAEAAAQLASDYHPVELAALGLPAAIQSFVKEFAQRHSLGFSICTDSVAEYLNPEQALHLFRIVQEALNNAGKHARASHVSLSLTHTRRTVELLIHDDGTGFDVESASSSRGGLGLTTMKERVAILKGDFTIRSQPGRGTTIKIRVPVER